MIKNAYKKVRKYVDNWLTEEPNYEGIIPCDFNRLKYEIKPGDVLLIEGHSRVSNIIRGITQSPWTHAALYIGRLIDFEDEKIKDDIRKHIDTKENKRLIIEGLLDRGTVVSPLSSYKKHHIRICRPIGITPADTFHVVNYAVQSLGQPYNVRHLLDLMRFLLPWRFLPRRWGSSLFRTSTGAPDSQICSSLIAEAFSSVQFPILPFLTNNANTGMEVFQRNPHLFSPKDFDYSPYFEIIKYPFFNPDEPLPYYRRLPWTKSGMLHQDQGILTLPTTKSAKSFNPFKRKSSNNKKTEENTPANDVIHRNDDE